jgi:hypothetical protein
MFPQWLLDLGTPQFQGWTIPIAGIVVAGLAFATGTLVLGRRKSPPRLAPSPPAGLAASQEAPNVDPFLQGGANERRNSYRREGTSVEVLICDAEVKTTPVPGLVVDRSLGGVGIRAPSSFAVGTILSLRPCNAPSVAPWVQVEVKSCRQYEETWDLGCQFLRTPPYSVLLLFG